jgi:hypothetical protein
VPLIIVSLLFSIDLLEVLLEVENQILNANWPLRLAARRVGIDLNHWKSGQAMQIKGISKIYLNLINATKMLLH